MTFKEKIKKAKALALFLSRRDGIAESGSCVYHALAVREIFKYPIVAGSASWRLLQLDDGVSPTHFSYVFEPNNLVWVPESDLPEMHVWNVFQGKVLDLTTSYWPEQCKKLIGMDWKDIRPPNYHYGKPIQKNGRWLYKENPIATEMAKLFVEKIGVKI